jgi:hypothetical protein
MPTIRVCVSILCCVSAAMAAEPPSPFADKPCESYSAFRQADGRPGVLLWGKAPLDDFGSRPVTFDPTGVRQLRPAPPPGVHPRILFGPDDLADVRARVRETRCGQQAWKHILCWTEAMKGRYDDAADYARPDRFKGGFGGLRGPVPLFRLGAPAPAKGAKYVRSEPAAALWAALADGSAREFPAYYWNTLSLEAFRCLIDDDAAGSAAAAGAMLTMLRLDQAKRDSDRKAQQAKKPGEPLPPPAQPVGGFQLAFAYDFLFNRMTPAQRAEVQAELAATTWSHDNYGTFNTAESSRSNWATFSYWLFQVLAIEGEPGFNELKVRGMYRGWRNLLTYGWFQSGATYEGEAKNQLGMDGVILFAMRARQYGFDNLAAHPYLQAYARSFLPHSANAMLTGFHKYDLLGGSRAGSGGFASIDSIGLKFMFPDDRIIDWCYRQAMGDDYGGVPDRPDGYYNGLLFFAVFASDYLPDNRDPKALNLGTTFFCGERALVMTRSSWDPGAMQLAMHVRQANGGHPFADRNAIMVAGAGRIWSPNGYASFRTFENSVVTIDGQSQSETVPGRLVDFADRPQATFAVGDAKYAWDWSWSQGKAKAGIAYPTAADVRDGNIEWPPGSEPVLHTTNDFAYLKLPHAYLNRPLCESGHWILPSGAVSPVARSPRFPVIKAFRTAGLVRGPQPYAVVVDDIRKDSAPHRYDWTLAVEPDVQIASIDRRSDGICDLLLTGFDPDQKGPRAKEPLGSRLPPDAEIPAGQPMLLVRVLAGLNAGDAEPAIVELPNAANPKKYAAIRRLVLASQAIEPGFKVLLVPHRRGERLPQTVWNTARDEATCGGDRLRFAPSASGKTDVTILRDGATIVAVTAPIAPLADSQEDARRAAAAKARRRLATFKPDALPALMKLPAIPGATAGTVGPVLTCTGAKEGVVLPVDLRAFVDKGLTVACWIQADPPAGSFLASGGNRGLSLSIEHGRALRIDTAGQHRWQGNLPSVFARWQHVAFTANATSVALFIDGRQIRTGQLDKPLRFDPTLTLGAGLTGRLADLRVFERVLEPDELADLVDFQRLVQGGP